jgi:hypothetical protein
MVKQAAQMVVTMPTSRSFFLRPRLSIGKRCSIRNRRPPYSRNPTAAASDTDARKLADRRWEARSWVGLAAIVSYVHRPAWRAAAAAGAVAGLHRGARFVGAWCGGRGPW